jgi:Protein of unknown function (DUF2846)
VQLKKPATSLSIVLGILGVVLVGCSIPMKVSLKQHDRHYSHSSNPNQGLVYIYREDEWVGSIRGIYITANGKRVGALNNGTYFVYQAVPGKNVFCAENRLGDPACRTLSIDGGQTYYIRGNLKSGFWDAVPQLTIVHDAEGAGATESLKYTTLE